MSFSMRDSLDGARGSTKETWQIAIDYVIGRKKAEKALGFLVKADELLASQIKCDESIEAVARMFCKYNADACVIDALGPESGLHQLAFEGGDNFKLDKRTKEGINTFLYSYVSPITHGVLKVIEDGKYEVTRIGGAEDGSEPNGRQRHLYDYGFNAALIVPILRRGKVIGSTSIFSSATGAARVYTGQDLLIISHVNSRISAALEIQSLHESSIALA